MSVPICSRSSDIIEPKLKEQWFLDCSDMAMDAIQVWFIKNKIFILIFLILKKVEMTNYICKALVYYCIFLLVFSCSKINSKNFSNRSE